MKSLATTKMSSKGQVVIPEEVRRRLGLEPGTQFIVIGDKEVIVLKKLSPPSMDEFDELISLARKQAKQAGLKKADIRKAIAKVRSRK